MEQLWALWRHHTLYWPTVHVHMPPKPTVARVLPVMSQFSPLWDYALSIHIVHRHRVHQADQGDLICGEAAAQRDCHSSSLASQTLGLHFFFFFFAPPLHACCPQASVPCPVEMGWKQWLIGALRLIRALMHSGQCEIRQPQLGCVQSSCGGMDQQEVATTW